MVRHTVQDFVIGERHASPEHELTQPEVIDFASKYDPQYYHVDPVAARDSQFGGLIACGAHTVSLCWKLALASGVYGDSMLAGLGLDEIRWVRPVRPGDRVHVEFWLAQARASRSQPDRAIATFQYEMKNQRGEIVVTLKMTQLLRSDTGDSNPASPPFES